MKFVVFSRRDWLGRKRWYFHLVSLANGEIVAQSEGYSRRVDCYETINLIRARAGAARLDDPE
jgi:uncharacterized protein YegP (UPF0339 family)